MLEKSVFRTTNGIQSPTDQTLWQIKVRDDLFNHFGSYRKLYSSRLVLEGKTGTEITEPTRSAFLEFYFIRCRRQQL